MLMVFRDHVSKWETSHGDLPSEKVPTTDHNDDALSPFFGKLKVASKHNEFVIDQSIRMMNRVTE